MWGKRSRSDPHLADGGSPDPEARPSALASVREAPPSPSLPLLPQAALVCVQAAVCVGAVYLKSALASVPHYRRGAPLPAGGARVFSPTVYAFYREAAASVLLCGGATAATGVAAPARRDLGAVAGAGFLLFLSQALYIHGIDAAGVAAAAAMQPAIPIWTAALACAAGRERLTRRKVGGTLLAAAGAVCMVSGPAHAVASAATAAPPHAALLGKVALALNTVSMALYYVVTKALVARYPPLCVAGWAYAPAALSMAVAAALTTPAAAWPLPVALRGPLAYWILVCSVAGYGLTAWASKHLPASVVAAFTCLQPFLGTAMAAAFLGEAVSGWDAGALGVLAGLAIVAGDGGAAAAVARRARARPATPLAPPPPGWGKEWRAA